MMIQSRGVLYIKWGQGHDAMLNRSVASLKKYHPELPIHVQALPDTATLLDKAAMADFTPFDQTLFLDTDTVIMDRLDFGFDQAHRFGLACSICECPWARRYAGLSGDLIEYNTGVLFFTRASGKIFSDWKTAATAVDSSIEFEGPGKVIHRMPLNDQAGFAQAISAAGFNPFVLPSNWNYRPRFQPVTFGPIKIWHDYSDPPPGLEQWSRNQTGEVKRLQAVSVQVR